MKKRPVPESNDVHIHERIIDRERDSLRVDVINDTLFLEPEAAAGAVSGQVIALDRGGALRLRALCDAFLGEDRKSSMEVPVTLTVDTAEAQASIDRLRTCVEELATAAEKMGALGLQRLGGTTNVTNMAPQDPEASWRAIRDILADAKSGRLTVAQAGVALRTAVTLIGHEEAQMLLEPYAKEQVPQTPVAPPWAGADWPVPPGHNEQEWRAHASERERRMYWVMLYNGGSMADLPEPSDAELRAYVGRIVARMAAGEPI